MLLFTSLDSSFFVDRVRNQIAFLFGIHVCPYFRILQVSLTVHYAVLDKVFPILLHLQTFRPRMIFAVLLYLSENFCVINSYGKDIPLRLELEFYTVKFS